MPCRTTSSRRRSPTAALGHLHRPQSVGRATIRYAGSLFPLSAAERAYQHGVSIVSIGAGGVAVEHLPLTRPVPFIRLPAAGALERSEIPGAFDAIGPRSAACDRSAPLRPCGGQGERHGGRNPRRGGRDRQRLSGPGGGAAEIVRSSAPAIGSGDLPGPSPPQLKDIDPLDLFTQAFVACHQAVPGEIHLRAFAAARDEA